MLTATAIHIDWDSPKRIGITGEKWLIYMNCGIRKHKNDKPLWRNPFFYVRILGLTIGIAFLFQK